MTKVTRFRLGAAGLALLGAGLLATSAQAAFFHVGDGSIDGNLCLGLDCISVEIFGFDTFRLKENNLRLHFDDTSSTGTFPDNDWRIIINDTASGGADYFAIEDSGADGSGTTQVFRIEAGAPANSLYVNQSGFVGIGAAAPARDLHIRSGALPTLRLEQDGSFGSVPQTWDVFSSNIDFAIGDITNATAPFRIRTGAPDNSIRIAATGRIGMGTSAPDAPLEVIATATSIGLGNAVIKLVNPTGPTAFQLDPNDDGTFWNMTATADNNNYRLSRSGTGAIEMSLASTGDLTIRGTITTGGPTCGMGCDRVFDKDYDLPTIAEHASQMWAAGYLPAVGPTAPSAPVNLTDRYGNLLNELEMAHIYIAQLNEEKEILQAKVSQLESLESRLARLEGLLSR